MPTLNQNEMQQLTRLHLKAKFFKGLADSTRLSVFEALRNGEKNSFKDCGIDRKHTIKHFKSPDVLKGMRFG